ncbi:membrane protein (plasmid) [Candidatus Paracaedimonas acanthamoebae]|nr:membrane protein [Candidatus Paracaedimonas acanthamoebae]
MLAIIGALNWGLVGIFKFDLVAFLFGEMSTGSRAVYTLVGLAGLYLLITLVQRAINN